MSLIFSNLVVIKTLSSNHRMYNLFMHLSKYLRYAKFLKISSMIRVMFTSWSCSCKFSTKWWR